MGSWTSNVWHYLLLLDTVLIFKNIWGGPSLHETSKYHMVLLKLWMIDPSICMVCIHRPQFLISCKIIDICVKFSSFPVILIIAGVLPFQSPALNSITTYMYS